MDAVLENDLGHTTVRDDDILDDGLDEGLDDLAINRPDELGSILAVALHGLLHHDEVACFFDEGILIEGYALVRTRQLRQPGVDSFEIVKYLLPLQNELLLRDVLISVQEQRFESVQGNLLLPLLFFERFDFDCGIGGSGVCLDLRLVLDADLTTLHQIQHLEKPILPN